MVFYFQKIVIFSYAVLFINRENEVLKVQLKKYVGAVQMLRREGQAVEGKDKGKKNKKIHAQDSAIETEFIGGIINSQMMEVAPGLVYKHTTKE